MGRRAEALAARIEQGARDLEAAAASFSEAAWRTECAGEGRTVGVLVHHVAAAYPLEAQLITTLAAGGELPGLGWEAVHQGNAEHASVNAGVGKDEALDLLRQNSAEAATAIRELSDEQLDRTARTALHWEAPLTIQFLIEQHPIAHPYIHLESIRAALRPATGAGN